jgi:hypothetical protein
VDIFPELILADDALRQMHRLWPIFRGLCDARQRFQ